MKTIEEFIKATHKDDKYIQRPRIWCNDKFNMSVQGSEFNYCSPRSLQDYYTEMEIGFPSKKEPIDTEIAYRESKHRILCVMLICWILFFALVLIFGDF